MALAAICKLTKAGARRGMVSLRVVLADAAGVRSKPDCVAKNGVSVITLATVPVCRRISLAPLGKMASVVLAGIVKATTLPPEEYWMDGSAENDSDSMVSSRAPCRGRG